MKVIDKKHFLATTRIYKDDGLEVAHNKTRVRRLIKAQEEIDAIPLDKVKQAREEINLLPIYGAKFKDGIRIHIDKADVIELIDNLIAESEDK